MIYIRARFANEERTQVIGWDAQGNSETVPWDHKLFRQPEHGPSGFIEAGGVIGAYQPAPVVTTPPQPQLFAAVAVNIEDGAISSVEQAAQFGQLIYEDGWLMAVFAGAGDAANYMVFAQPDIPARVEQFKSEGGFELVFSDATTGDPVNPNRIDIQILKVR